MTKESNLVPAYQFKTLELAQIATFNKPMIENESQFKRLGRLILERDPDHVKIPGSAKRAWILGFEIGARDHGLRIAKVVAELASDRSLSVDEQQLLLTISELIVESTEKSYR